MDDDLCQFWQKVVVDKNQEVANELLSDDVVPMLRLLLFCLSYFLPVVLECSADISTLRGHRNLI
jgi:hypothetical protein